jgi:signal transduction histidine kinase
VSALASMPNSATRVKPRVTRAVASAIGIIGAGVCALSVVYVVKSVPRDQAAARGAMEVLVVGLPIAAGLYALRAPRHERFGLLLIAAGFAWSLTALAESSESVPYSIGRVAGWLVFPSLIYLTLAYPQGRIAPGFDRALFRAFNLLLVLLFIGSALFVEAYPDHTPWATCDSDCPRNAFMVVDREPPAIEALVQPLRELLAAVLFAGALVSMARRWRAATPLQRRASWPVMLVTGISAIVLMAFFAARRLDALKPAADALGLVWGLCVAGIAAAFLVGLVRRRLLLGHVLARLAERLSSELDLSRVREVLASTLGDPTLELFVPDGAVHWRDSHGESGSLPPIASGREVTILGDQGAPAVALIHDAELRADDELLGAVGALVLGTMRQHRITTRLAGALHQLEQSRRRIAEAADQERARIERDLHDGAQQRLMMLRIRLSLAEELLPSDPAAGADAVHELGAEVDRTLDELRSLAHGVYPAILNDRGLEDALRSLVGEAPVPVHVQTRGLTRQSTEVETAVYFTCAEAVQNAIKHAHGMSAVWIDLRQSHVIALEVRDDGPGFTPPRADQVVPDQNGLRNMRDRLEAVGGRLTVDASPGHGTRIIGVVPLE